MESAKYIMKEAVQAILDLDFVEDTSGINRCIQKTQSNDIFEIMVNVV